MNKKSIFLSISIILSILLIFSVYLEFSLEDSYFPYWDTYDLKEDSKKLEQDSSFIADPLFFYNVRIFQEVTSLDYYFIIKFGKFFFLFLLLLPLYLILRIMSSQKNLGSKGSTLLSLIYLSFCSYFFLRFSMTLRENMVLGVGFLMIYLLEKLYPSEKLSFLDSVLVSILFAYLFGSHILVFLLTSIIGVIYLFLKSVKRKNFKEYLWLFLLAILFSSPFLSMQYSGVLGQLTHGGEILIAKGVDFSRDYITLSFFNPLVDSLIFFLGLFILIKSFFRNSQPYRSFTIYFFTIALLYGISFIENFGIRQNRLAIYIYLFFSFMVFIFVENYRSHNYHKAIVPIFLLVIILIMVPGTLDYQGYRPINEENLNFIEELINYQRINLERNIYCGPSACVALIYLYGEDLNVTKIGPNELDRIRSESEPQIILFNDDWESFKKDEYRMINKFIQSNEEGIFLEPKLRRKLG